MESLSQVEDMVCLRVAWWFKYLGGGSMDLITHMLLNIVECCLHSRMSKFSNLGEWIPSQVDMLQFNVDGSAMVLRVRRVLVECRGIMMVPVSWIINDGFGSVKHAQIIQDIRAFLNNSSQISVLFCPRSFNCIVDHLAKKGSRISGEVKNWG
ncbi:hypothetical protein Ddye_012131, partial [Dipteronia dyeriana]